MRSRAARGIPLALSAIAVTPVSAAGPGCTLESDRVELPRELRESSGVAVSLRDPNLLWTHNDDGSVLYALGADGRVRGRLGVEVPLRDWEDLAAGRCSAGSCLYFADTGDNAERRRAGDVRILRAVEPDLGTTGSVPVEAFPVLLPDGPRDIEALFVLPGERPYLITKGRNHPITVYRYPPPLRPVAVTLEEVQRLSNRPEFLLDGVTGADASPDGAIVAVRTYQALRFYRVQADTLSLVPNGLVDLRPLREAQGEAVAIGREGRVALTSEGGPFGAAPSLHLLRCALTELGAAPDSASAR